MSEMKAVIKSNRNWITAYLIIGLFNAFTVNYKANYFQRIVDGLTGGTITAYGILIYGGILFVNYGMSYLDEYPNAKLGSEIYLDFKLLALKKISRMDYSQYQKLGTGKLVQQIEHGANAGKGVLFDFWLALIRNLVPTILFSLYFIWKIDPNVTYFLLAGYVIVFLVTNLLLKGLYRIKESILTNEEELNHFLVRGFMEMPLFRMNRQFPNEMKKASRAKGIIVSSKVKMTMIHEAFFTIFALLVAGLDIGLLVYAWKYHRLSVGSVVALITLIDHAYTPIAIFNVLYVQYKLNRTAWLRFSGLLHLKEDGQLREGMSFNVPLEEIRLENLSFAYENKPVLKDICLTIKRGEKIAFVGESGSGKSTLVKLIIGLLKYEEGEILFNGASLKHISLESLYRRISYFSQDTPVFDGTIRENLIFDQDLPDEKLCDSLEHTQLLPLLTSLEHGLDTRIGEKGTCLSGGEKQRLALSRLWHIHPDLVILDEATSAIDNLTEAMVMKQVNKQAAQATVITIVHRLASIREFDRIVVFRNGRIVGNGSVEELLKENDYFQKLYQKEKTMYPAKIESKN